MQVLVTVNLMDGNFMLLARAEHWQGGGPFLSAPIRVTVSPVVTSWPDALCLANPGKNWRYECCFVVKHIINCVVDTPWIVHLLSHWPWLILQVSKNRSCLIIAGYSDSPEWHILLFASGLASGLASFPGAQNNCYSSCMLSTSHCCRLPGFVLIIWLAWQLPNKSC